MVRVFSKYYSSVYKPYPCYSLDTVGVRQRPGSSPGVSIDESEADPSLAPIPISNRIAPKKQQSYSYLEEAEKDYAATTTVDNPSSNQVADTTNDHNNINHSNKEPKPQPKAVTDTLQVSADWDPFFETED